MSLLGGSENIAGVVEKVEENGGGGGDGGERHYLVFVEEFEKTCTVDRNWNDRWALWRETWWGLVGTFVVA
ncbi:hypothetical protein L195_g022143 [Trifolium pratense]|uniref:Uncharacterized protein n=1 Tax=Trifolium pratense TaxID=57577 RepID=A0A2K3N756_TRIPR|nr:hypothetical protein L195_g022143 [Trifolium pratense]